MRIGIDIDGVLTNIEQWQLDYGGKFFSKYYKGVVNRKGYEIADIFGASEELDNKFWNEYLYEYATKEPARKFTSEVIKKIKTNNNEIYIITSRYLTDRNTNVGQEMRNIVLDWLKWQNIVYDKVIFAPEDKLQICLENNIDVMIEDCVANVERISTRLPVICFHAEYNKHCKNDNVYRVYSWYDIYNLINGDNIYNKKESNKL